MKKKRIILKCHIYKETDFWITVHFPQSGIILELLKKDLTIEEIT